MLTDLSNQMGVKLAIASIAVAFALMLFFLIARAWRQRGSHGSPRRARSRGPRLAVVDTATVDQKRRLLLVRRDDVEHLILVGGPSDIVVESRIATDNATPRADAEPPRASEPARVDTAVASAAAGTTNTARPAAGEAVPNTPSPAPGIAAAPVHRAPEAQNEPVPEVDVDEMFDSHRERVFGPSDTDHGTSPYARAYRDVDTDHSGELPQRRTAAPEESGPRTSVVRFEDFLDEETDSDLSHVRPSNRDTAAPEGTIPPRSPASSEERAKTADDRVLNDEMSRLLSDLSHKR